MNAESQTQADQARSWQDEIAALLAQPVSTSKEVTREGKTVGLHLVPQQRQDDNTQAHKKIDLFVSLFTLYHPPLEDEKIEAGQAALSVFLKGLHNKDSHTRMAACEALGQLGNPAARSALQAALQDQSRYVRLAATKALTALDAPRLRTEELAGVRLLLWQQVRHLWKPLGTARTNTRGQALFSNLPPETTCRLQLLAGQQQGQATLAARISADLETEEPAEEAFAAEEIEGDTESLPQSHRLELEDGSLLGTLYRNVQDQLVIEFRSDAEQLTDGYVSFSVTSHKTKDELLSECVMLVADEQGVLTGRFVLSEVLDFTQVYEVHFEPVVVPK